MEKKYVCPCGLTCCDCMFYKAEIYDVARKLRALLIDNKMDFFLSGMGNEETRKSLRKHLELSEDEYFEKLGSNIDTYKNMPIFMEVLNNIIELQCKSTCQESGGCSMAGNTKECGALKCIKNNGYEGCWECSEYESCEQLNFLRKGYGSVIAENLNTVKHEGFDAVKSRGDEYYTWQRKLKK